MVSRLAVKWVSSSIIPANQSVSTDHWDSAASLETRAVSPGTGGLELTFESGSLVTADRLVRVPWDERTSLARSLSPAHERVVLVSGARTCGTARSDSSLVRAASWSVEALYIRMPFGRPTRLGRGGFVYREW